MKRRDAGRFPDADAFLDKIERNFGWIMFVWAFIVLAVFGVLGFVAWHFLAKVW